MGLAVQRKSVLKINHQVCSINASAIKWLGEEDEDYNDIKIY